MTPVFAYLTYLPWGPGPPEGSVILYDDGHLIYDDSFGSGVYRARRCTLMEPVADRVRATVGELLHGPQELVARHAPNVHDHSFDAVWFEGQLYQLDGPLREGSQPLDVLVGPQLRAIAQAASEYCTDDSVFVPTVARYSARPARSGGGRCWPRHVARWPADLPAPTAPFEATAPGAEVLALKDAAERHCDQGGWDYLLRVRGQAWRLSFYLRPRPGDERWVLPPRTAP